MRGREREIERGKEKVGGGGKQEREREREEIPTRFNYVCKAARRARYISADRKRIINLAARSRARTRLERLVPVR